MSDLITSLRALAAARHDDLSIAVDAVIEIERQRAENERLSRERDEARSEVRRMRELLVTIQRLNSERDVALSRERDEARAALKPFAILFLWPDDLDESSAADIRAEEDWNEAENDARSDDLWVRRGDIRAARKALQPE